ncbi:MAG TPA: aspartyl-tRNA amidotransferase [Candidatus Moranbacteria bacterium]|nr:aspartyl-tRNA amidotransferase [Candidatus Moranbacteria bacterium]HBT46249.1 aspartyl-tRNA amidotransferase [Candidatus Moranbacteria bacterium]
MTLKEKIISDLKDAMKSGDSVRRDTLRLLDSAVKNLEIEKKKRETGLDDAEVLEVISRAVKQRQDSIRQFEDGGRADLAEKEKIELEIIMPYLPAQLSKEAITAIVSEVIAQTGSAGVGDLGKVMGQAMSKMKGEADGNVVREIAKQLLEK